MQTNSNPWLNEASAINRFYDSDFPSEHFSTYPENFDAITDIQGIRYDVERYLKIARRTGAPVLELCCGTGRVALPLGAAGFDVVAVDNSTELMRQFRRKLTTMPTLRDSNIELVQQDVTQLDLNGKTFPLVIVAFNSLLCIPDFEQQIRVLRSVATHMTTDSLLVLDLINPVRVSSLGNSNPQLFFTRREPSTGRLYSRFAGATPFDASQCQTLFGWYDEVDENGCVRRMHYSVDWRLIYRFEIQLMLEACGLKIVRIEGGHSGEEFRANSERLFVHAKLA